MMTQYEKATALKPKDFKQIIGVKHETFVAMLEYWFKHTPKSIKMEAGLQNCRCPIICLWR